MPTRKDKGPSGGRTNGHSSYYYVQGKQIHVSKRDDLVAVSFHSRAPVEKIRAFAASPMPGLEQSSEFQEMQGETLRIFKVAPSRSADAARLTAGLRGQENVEKVGDVYVSDSGSPLVLTDELAVKFKPEMTSDEIETLRQSYDMEAAEPLGFSENAFLVRLKPDAAKSALDIANELVESGQAVYANPNWIEYLPHRIVAEMPVETALRHAVNDPLYPNQWHLENTGQGGGLVDADVDAHTAWHTTMGSPNITVAIVDAGIDTSHEDLNSPGKIVFPIDLDVDPPDNNPFGDAHGTACAGVAVATQNNARGVSGVAPGSRLMPIKAAAGATSDQIRLARAFQYLADRGADVASCSLGPDGVPWIMREWMQEAIDYATTYGRRGRGCPIFWAGGNGNESISTDQVVSYERTIAVGACNNLDRRSAYSDFGPELDMVAPSSDDPPPQGTGTRRITTTTNTGAGSAKVDPSRNYIDIFGGTSSASPLAAGIGALVLSINNNLSWEEVRQILIDSAKKIDSAAHPYLPAPLGRPPGTRNDLYGYGKVNARRAVELARAGSNRDLFIRDTLADTGNVPQPAWGFWDSPDIWIRNIDDGGTVHQDTIRGQDNYFHARIWNRGSRASLPCWVRFYVTSWAHTEFRYPYDFKPDTTTAVAGGTPGNLRPRNQFPAPGTYLLGVQRIESIPAGGNAIAKIRWERALIPPAANWHPCLLVEISPHDGPAASGVYVWENNNLGQKNISIVNARRGEFLKFPYRFGHALTKDPFVTLSIQKTKVPQNWQVFVDMKQPKMVEEIAGLAGIVMPAVPVDIFTPVIPLPLPSPGASVRPWRLTFLDEARIAIGGTLPPGETRSEQEGVLFTFPRGSSLEVGTGRMADLVSEEPLPVEEIGSEEGEPERAPRPVRPAFSIAAVDGIPVLALHPVTKTTSIKVPMARPAVHESVLQIRVPDNAVPGESYVFDIAERNSKGQLVGGVRLQVNVVA
ncbi:MAG: S8 family serine peptidase [Bryobacterales bacterium]|nr:S8 family serine peptidase [Bryobacterales bacterium]